MDLRSQWNNIPKPKEDSSAQEKKAIEEQTERVQAELLSAAEPLVADLSPLLSSDKLDSKLLPIAILTHGTPRGFAEFAQKGTAQEKLIEQLFADEALMRQVLEAGGANGGAYGNMMEIYTAILAKSEKARERGTIFQRLALGTRSTCHGRVNPKRVCTASSTALNTTSIRWSVICITKKPISPVNSIPHFRISTLGVPFHHRF